MAKIIFWYEHRSNKKARNYFEKIFLNWWIIQFLEKVWKIWENIEITLICHNRKKRRNCLVSEPNYHTTICLTEYLLAIEMKKTQILMNKPIYWGLSTLELSNILVQEFW